MHRRVFAAVLLVVCLTTTVPAFSATRRGSDPTFMDRIVQMVKRILHPLDLNDPIPPKP